jgi:hypothetical protein
MMCNPPHLKCAPKLGDIIWANTIKAADVEVGLKPMHMTTNTVSCPPQSSPNQAEGESKWNQPMMWESRETVDQERSTMRRKENSTRKDQLQAAFLKPYGPLQYTDRYRDAAFTILSYSKHAQDCSWSTPIGAQFFVTFSHHIIYFQLLKHCHTNFS